jgi:Cu+-exporting ATPase
MTAIDPVCGMEVEESTARWKTTYQGQTYYFCAPGCLGSFQQEPAKYAAAGSSAGQPQQPPSHEPDHGRMAGDHS